MKTQIKKPEVTMYFQDKIILEADCPFFLIKNNIPISHLLYRFENIKEGTLIKYKDINDKIGYMFWADDYGFIECGDIYEFSNEENYNNYIKEEDQFQKRIKSKVIVNNFIFYSFDMKKEFYEFINNQNFSRRSSMKNDHYIITNNFIIVEMLSTCNIKNITGYSLSNFVYKITDIKPYDILYYLNIDNKLETVFYNPNDKDFVSFNVIKKDLSGFTTKEYKKIAIAFVKGNLDEEYDKIKLRKKINKIFIDVNRTYKDTSLNSLNVDKNKSIKQISNNSRKYSLDDFGGSIRVIYDLCTVQSTSFKEGKIRFDNLKDGDIFAYQTGISDHLHIKFWYHGRFLDFNKDIIGFPVDWVLEDTKKYLSRMVKAWVNGRWCEEKALIDMEIAESFKDKTNIQSNPTTIFITTFIDRIVIPRYSTAEFESTKEYENKLEVKFKNLKDGDVLCFIKKDDINRGFWIQYEKERKEKIKLLHFQFWYKNRFIDFTSEEVLNDISWITPDNVPRMVKAFLTGLTGHGFNFKNWNEEKEKIKKETLLLLFSDNKENKDLTIDEMKKLIIHYENIIKEIDKNNKDKDEFVLPSNLSTEDKEQLVFLIEKIISNSKDNFNILEEGIYYKDWYIHIRRVKKKDKIIITIEKIKDIDMDGIE